MRRTTALLFVLALLTVTATSAVAHDQKITDGQNDAVDFSDDTPSANTATPLDFKSVLFSETSRKFVVTIRMHSAVTPDELCDGNCALADQENEGSIVVDIFKGTTSDPKNHYFIFIGQSSGGEYAAGLYDSNGNLVANALVGQILDDGRGFLLKITRGKVRGYPKGAKLKWLATSAYAGDANSSDCVPNDTAPYFGNCWDYVPNTDVAKHTLRS